tara:strand:+ start:622 stop:942 length:321 start_codon:yes stop_codon:yes gene_type:complete
MYINTRFQFGPAASHTYITYNEKETQITFDWSYDSVYFKFPDETKWYTINLSNPVYEIINTEEKLHIFRLMVNNVNENLKNYEYNGVSDALIKLNKISEYYDTYGI